MCVLYEVEGWCLLGCSVLVEWQEVGVVWLPRGVVVGEGGCVVVVEGPV